jgi:hypothetical protein
MRCRQRCASMPPCMLTPGTSSGTPQVLCPFSPTSDGSLRHQPSHVEPCVGTFKGILPVGRRAAASVAGIEQGLALPCSASSINCGAACRAPARLADPRSKFALQHIAKALKAANATALPLVGWQAAALAPAQRRPGLGSLQSHHAVPGQDAVHRQRVVPHAGRQKGAERAPEQAQRAAQRASLLLIGPQRIHKVAGASACGSMLPGEESVERGRNLQKFPWALPLLRALYLSLPASRGCRPALVPAWPRAVFAHCLGA